MLKKLLFAFIVVMPFNLKSQVTLTSQLPSGGILLKEQLWNIVISNNGNDVINLKMELNVRDALSGQSVLNATSNRIVIGKGIHIVNLKDLEPLVYNYQSIDFAGNYLPCGSYLINYRAFQEGIHSDLPVADEVLRVIVAPLSPPILLTPADKSIIESLFPQFTWVPPVPAEMFKPLDFDISLVEVKQGQSAKEAIEYNSPIYINNNLKAPFDNLPSSYSGLEKNKTYAWQVIGRNGLSCAVPSNVFIFSIGKDSLAQIISNAPYIRISRSNTEVVVVQQGFLKMEYDNINGENNGEVAIYKAGEKDKRAVISFSLRLSNGKNFLMYDLNKKARLDQKSIYEVSFKNERGEFWYMKFIPKYYR